MYLLNYLIKQKKGNEINKFGQNLESDEKMLKIRKIQKFIIF
jgi:hypothetical protein